jgi:maltose alpha-D-glucosyltransferase/alpha-amylase
VAERTPSAVDAGLPVLHVAGDLHDALTQEVLARLTTEDLTRFVSGRRWFAAKAGAPRAARISHVVPLAWDDGAFAIARLDVETASGARHCYQLPLAVRERAAPTEALAHVETPTGDGVLFEAVEDAAFRRHVADAFARGARFDAGSASWIIEPVGAKTLVVPLEAPIELGKAEQSNTSIRFADEGILKLFRRLEPGEHPDVEISRFLTLRASFPNTPALFGVARFEDRDLRTGAASITVAAMLQEFLPKSMDGWSYVTKRAEAEGGRGAASGTSDLSPSSFAREARRLGEVTRALHDALASAGPDEPDFAPEPARPSDVAEWAAATEKQARDAIALLKHALQEERLPSECVDDARSLVARHESFLERVRALAAAVRGDAGRRIRHHGDYHLGQVLRTAAGEFLIIDFEGEPSKPLAERRRKHSALRDVAGMLRSFAYAGATIEVGERRAAGGEWERDAREAFLAGYLENAPSAARRPPPAFLPHDRRNIERLLGLFEMEKRFYELGYELNNRPDWVWIPLRGIMGEGQ